MKGRKGLGFLAVALRGVNDMPAKDEDEERAARATQMLVIWVGGFGW